MQTVALTDYEYRFFVPYINYMLQFNCVEAVIIENEIENWLYDKSIICLITLIFNEKTLLALTFVYGQFIFLEYDF